MQKSISKYPYRGSMAVVLASTLLCACGGGGDHVDSPGVIHGDPSAISDADAAPDQVQESALPGTPVGLTLSLPSVGGSPVIFSLLDSAGGAFTIDPVSGVVSLATGVDFEASPVRTIVARLDVGQPPNRRLYDRAYPISILDSPAPALRIDFPFTHARFGDAAISAAGIVSHPELASVRVSASAGGAVVQGEIVGGKFQVRDVPISGAGTFTLTVVATHPGGDTTTQSMTLSREPELTDVSRMVLDAPRARVLMVDRYTATVIASPLDGGPRTIVSGRQVGAGPPFVEPLALCLDPDGQTLYVVDGTLEALYRVDLLSGNRTRLVGSGPPIYAPMELDFDAVRHKLVLSDENSGVFSIDPVTGERLLLSSYQNNGPTIYAYRGLALDPLGDRILVSDGSSIFGVNPVNGDHTLISASLSDPISRFLYGMTVAPHANLAYAADEFTNGVVKIDLATGVRETVTSSGLSTFNYLPVGSGPDLQYPADVIVTPDDRLFLIEGEYADPLIEVRANGDRVIVRNAALGNGVNFRGPAHLKFDAARQLLLAADNVADFLAEIDPATGNRTVISGRSDGKGSIDFDLMDGAFDVGGQFYYIDARTKSLNAVRAGETPRVVSDMNTGSGPAFYYPTGIEIDAPQNTAYVIDSESVFALDLTTGDRRVITSGFVSLNGLAADLPNHRLFVSEGSGAVFSVDLPSGARRALSFPASDTIWSGDIAYDAATQSVFIVRENPARLERIDGTGAISPVDAPAPNCGPTLVRPIGVAVDSARQIGYVTDDFYDAIIAVDLRTGCRQLIAK